VEGKCSRREHKTIVQILGLVVSERVAVRPNSYLWRASALSVVSGKLTVEGSSSPLELLKPAFRTPFVVRSIAKPGSIHETYSIT